MNRSRSLVVSLALVGACVSVASAQRTPDSPPPLGSPAAIPQRYEIAQREVLARLETPPEPTVVVQQTPVYVQQPQPVYVQQPAPVVVQQAPQVIYAQPQVVYAAPPVVYAAPRAYCPPPVVVYERPCRPAYIAPICPPPRAYCDPPAVSFSFRFGGSWGNDCDRGSWRGGFHGRGRDNFGHGSGRGHGRGGGRRH
jgi:hypothetical protein